MQLSNRLTFSLASLILMVAFVAMPVTAHIDSTESGHTSADAATHTPHAVVKSVTAPKYTNGDDFEVTIAFVAANTANEVILPARGLGLDAAGAVDSGNAGDVTASSGTPTYTSLVPGTSLATHTIMVTGATANSDIAVATSYAFTPAAPTGTPTPPDPLRPTVMFDGDDTMFTVTVDTDASFTLSTGTTDTLEGVFTVLVKAHDDQDLTDTADTSSGIKSVKLSVMPAAKAKLVPADGMLTADNPYFGTKPDDYQGEYRAVVTPAADYTGELTFTVMIEDNAGNMVESSATATSFVKVKVKKTSTTPPPTVDDPATIDDFTGTIPAKSYVIVAKSATPDGLPSSFPDNLTEGSSATAVQTWADMPDLENLLFRGGTLLLTTLKATTLDRDNKATTDAEAAKKRDALITEVMAAVNTAKVGETGYRSHQWIELYNNLPVSIDVTLSATQGRPAPDASATQIRLERLSNVVGGGWKFEGLGQNGFDDDTVDRDDNPVPGSPNIDLVSFYRSNRAADKDGHVKGHWATSTEYYIGGHKGTPGAKERSTAPTIGATNANRGPVIINEVSNNDNPKYEWIELRNVSTGEVNLKNWEVTIATSKGTGQSGHNDVDFINFPNADRKLAAGGILLVVASDPEKDDNHPLQTGWNIEEGADAQRNGVNANSPRYIVLDFKTAKKKGTTDNLDESGLPDDGEFVLILRNRNDRNGKIDNNNIRDVAGYVPGAALKVDDANLFTGLWPLKNFAQPNWANNKLAAGTVQRRQFADIDGTKSKDKNQNDKAAFRDDDNGWTGIGYRRNADVSNQNGGTPGYAHGTLKGADTQAAADPVIISEIMYATGSRSNTPQWIELYNMSKTVGVNITDWQVSIVNHDQDDAEGTTFTGDLVRNYNITGSGKVIPPGQTFLLVAHVGTDATNLPSERVHALRNKRGELILSQYGFEITLKTKEKDGARITVDMAGNLATVRDGAGRVGNNRQSFETPAWMLPMGENEDGDRVSIVRRADMGVTLNGQMKHAWQRFDMSAHVSTRESTHYGHRTDISSPGHTVGGVLPVSLSKFRP
ncbi:MAG: lamin tail domain-containing protein, partial [Candidatus Poribacteria bacterium]|nr:lamin tail domain-containing protein [Candidatus Poribacteria bacterium]